MKLSFIIIISIVCVVGMYSMPPIAQDVLYHEFADQQSFFGIPHFLNVMSNIPFVLIGFAGLWLLSSDKNIALVDSIRFIYRAFFGGVLLVGIGSAYYHIDPDNSTLVWDRLPMAVAFMSFFTIVIAEFINEKLAASLFALLLFMGLASVIYWYWTETLGQGDLRLYLLVQFLPVVLMPLIFITYSSTFTKIHLFWLVLVCYGLAKGFEMLDFEVLEFTGFASGHTLKHLVSVLGPAMLYLALLTRRRV